MLKLEKNSIKETFMNNLITYKSNQEKDFFEFKNISKFYKSGKINVVGLQNINLKISYGDFIVIGGISGSGKSTLLNLMGLIDQPDQGDIFIENKKINYNNDRLTTEIRKNKIGFIFQNFNLIPTLTVFENIEYSLLKSIKEIKRRHLIINQALEKVGILNLSKRYPEEISGGQQQRTSIARAFAKSPSIILADEPTANLDSGNGENILEIMKTMNIEERVTFVIATHDSSIMKMAKRKIIVSDGKIIKDTRI